MNDSQRILVASIVAIVIIVGMVSYLRGNLSGSAAVPLYPTVKCGPGEEPVYVQETRFGTGKLVIVDCVPPGTVIQGFGTPFPQQRQRWLVPPR